MYQYLHSGNWRTRVYVAWWHVVCALYLSVWSWKAVNEVFGLCLTHNTESQVWEWVKEQANKSYNARCQTHLNLKCHWYWTLRALVFTAMCQGYVQHSHGSSAWWPTWKNCLAWKSEQLCATVKSLLQAIMRNSPNHLSNGDSAPWQHPTACCTADSELAVKFG
jgi:hypothetical protein